MKDDLHGVAGGSDVPMTRGAQSAAFERQVAVGDIAGAYLAILGREAEPAVLRPEAGRSVRQVLVGLLRSNEWRERVLTPLAAGAEPAHARLTPSQLDRLRVWLDLLEAPIVASAGRLHPAILLERSLSVSGADEILLERDADVWRMARAHLAAWAEEAAVGACGAIDYANGDAVTGWAVDPHAPSEPFAIDLLCNGVLVAAGWADRARHPPPDWPAASRSGFRLAWKGRRLDPGAKVLRLHSRKLGRDIGAPFELDPAFDYPRETLRSVSVELAEVRRTLFRLEALLPQLQSFAAFDPEQYDAFRRQHRVTPPPLVQPVAKPPTFAILVDAAGAPPTALRRLLASLSSQTWPAWRLLARASAPQAQDIVAGAAAVDSRIGLIPQAGDDDELAPLMDQPSNLALLGPPDMELDPTALAWFAYSAMRWPQAAGFYADGDRIARSGRSPPVHSHPVLRCGFDPWMLSHANRLGAVVCARTNALLRVRARLAGLTGADRAWACWAALSGQGGLLHIPRVLVSLPQGWEASEAGADPPPAAVASLAPTLRAFDSSARIGIVIPTRDGGPLLQECVDSLRRTARHPERLDILVLDNGGARGAMPADARVDVRPEPFNWARLNNIGAAQLKSELLLFLNDDTQAIAEGWDEALRGHLSDPRVGAVGALLAYPDMTIQHGGVLFGVDGLVANEGVGVALNGLAPDSRWRGARIVGAVTGAFLACRAADHARVGGFDEVNFPITCNDVDFCLRLREQGLLVIFEPAILFLHAESKSRGRDDETPQRRERAEFEASKFLEIWGDAVTLDPGYNPHWSRYSEPFAALSEPSAGEIDRHMTACGSGSPWLARRQGGDVV